jgi:outer membrane receptor protein involved in Fe transport
MGWLPSQAVLDARIVRRIEMWGPLKVDVMLEAFNLFNRTNYTEVNNVFGTGSYPDNPLPTFGLYQQAGPPRQIQVGVRMTF